MENDQLLEQIGLMMDRRMEAFASELNQRLTVFKEQIAEVVAGNAAELHTQIQGVEERLNARFVVVDSQLKRIIESQVSSLQSTITFMEWAHRTDDGLLGLMKRIEVLERRLSNPGGAI